MEAGNLKAPFPYFGGKSKVAHVVWRGLGNVTNYIEPFCGSAAVLLARPHEPHLETINDTDGYIVNAYRAIRADSRAVAAWADWPQFESDLHARHAWLVKQRVDLIPRLEGDPEYFDVKIAGWWLWGMALWIGGEFCSGNGPWKVVDSKLIKVENRCQGIRRRRLHLSTAGQGIRRRLLHLSDNEQGINRQNCHLQNYLHTIADRLARVRICCGDWTRVLGPAVLEKTASNGIFLDPPYDVSMRYSRIYTVDHDISSEVRKWCITHGEKASLRICIAGYAGEHEMPESWKSYAWKADGGMNRRDRGHANRSRERLWFSPHCLPIDDPQINMFGTSNG